MSSTPATHGPASPQPNGRRRPSTFRALSHRNFRLWFMGQGVSLVGTWMQTMAQQVLVYRLTGSAAALGIVSAIGLIPVIPLGLWGGSLADRAPKRTVILIAQTAMMIQAFILAFLTATGTVQVWHVYVMALLLAAAQAIDLPARQAFVVDMVDGKEDLTNAIALNSTIFQAARMLGPALAGAVVATLGEGPAFFLNGLTFLAVIGSLLLMRNLPPRRAAAKSAPVTRHMAEGVRYVLNNRLILVLTSLVAVSAFLSMPYSTLMPAIADRVLKTTSQPVVAALCENPGAPFRCQAPEALPLGMLLTAIGVGAVTGALLVASLPNDARRGPLLTAGNLLFPAGLLLFSLSRSFLVSLLLLVLIGIAFVAQNALANTLIQLNIPDELRGRVMSLYTLTFQVSMRAGGLQAGLVADSLGPAMSVGIGAVVSLAYGLFVAIRYPALRRMA
ncbi:MAG: MFS transporter [Anaerolineae bacterium]|jgi:MFS family permease|nr:MFS transporter [Anaerolineae bacterium]